MKRIFTFCLTVLLGFTANAQNVGINKNNAEATLDILSVSTEPNAADKVLRFSTKPSKIGSSDNFVFFVGKEENNGYNLRVASKNDLVKLLSNDFISEIPILRRIAVTNTQGQSFSKGSGNRDVSINKVIVNTSTDEYEFLDAQNSIRLKKGGVYEVTAWIGFDELTNVEGDIVLSVSRKPVGGQHENFKRTVVSRSKTDALYSKGHGVGASFSFVAELKKGEEIRLLVNAISMAVRTLPGSVSFVVAKVQD